MNSNPPLLPHSVLAIGLGCSRGADPAELRQLLMETLATHSLAHFERQFASLDIKAAEPAITQFGNITYFNATRLAAESPQLASPSARVAQHTGTPSVAEAAALALAGPQGRLLVPKVKSQHCTVAIATSPPASAQINRGQNKS